MRKFFSLFAAILFAGSMMATTYTATPSGTFSKSGGTITWSDVTWTYGSAAYLALNGDEIQIGSKNNPQTNGWTISTPITSFGENQRITSISIKARTGGTGSYDISADGTSVKSGDLSESVTTYTASDLEVTSGSIAITITGSSKAAYLGTITVVYEDAVTDPYVTVNPHELDFGSVETNTALEAKTFVLKGKYLTDANNVTVTAPAGFKVSTGEAEPAESVVLTPSSKVLSDTILVTPVTTTAGKFDGNITIASEDLAADSVVGVKLTVLTPVAVTSVELNKTSLTLYDGDTATLIATISPDEATNKKVTWESSAEAIATVDEKGLVTAIAKGVATITCKSVADPTKLATCELTVVGPDVILDFKDNTEWQIPVGNTKTTGTNTYTAGDYSVTLYGPSGNGYYYDGSVNNLMLGKTGAYMILPVFEDKAIVKVVTLGETNGAQAVTFNIYQGDDAVSTEVTGCNEDQTFQISPKKANTEHSLKVTNNNNIRLGKIKIYLGEPDPDPTAISNTNANAKAVKTIVNGQLLITRDGKTFNVLGTQVR